MNDGKELQPPVVKGHASTEPDDIPLAKRRKAVPAEKSTQRAESDVPVPTTTRVAPRQPARKPKVVPPLATIPEPQSTTSRRNPKRQGTAVPDQKKDITPEKKRVVTKKGEVDVPDGSGPDVDVDVPGPSKGVTGKQGSSVSKRTSKKKVVVNAKGASGGSKGKTVAPEPSDHGSSDEGSVNSSDEYIPHEDESESSEDDDDSDTVETDPEATAEVSVEQTSKEGK